MMGVSIDEPSFVFGDNKSVLSNIYLLHSTFKKKSPSIVFNFVIEGVSNNEWLKTYLNNNLNPSDILAKSLLRGDNK